MIELLILFWTFFKIGLFTFGGAYAMIPLIKTELVGGGYIDYDLLIEFIGISESTPGPIAINMATFIGMNQYGLLGALATTLGVALPSFIIILLIAKAGEKFINSKFMNHAFSGLRPTVIALIMSVSLILGIRSFIPTVDFKNLVFDVSGFQYKSFIILIIIILAVNFIKKLSPFKIILLSAVLGMIIFNI